jgi:hypothetical protein
MADEQMADKILPRSQAVTFAVLNPTSAILLCYGSVIMSLVLTIRLDGCVGEWLSLVEHLVRDQGVGGSNPLSPTNSNRP